MRDEVNKTRNIVTFNLGGKFYVSIIWINYFHSLGMLLKFKFDQILHRFSQLNNDKLKNYWNYGKFKIKTEWTGRCSEVKQNKLKEGKVKESKHRFSQNDKKKSTAKQIKLK